MLTAAQISNLLREAEEGNLDGLQCLQCHKSTVSVSLTHSVAEDYRVWFDCSECAFVMSGRYAGQPLHYS
jgi:hypothetical protein